MKKLLAVIAEFLFFLVLDVVGGVFYHPFQIESKLTGGQLTPREFYWDGVILMLAGWLLLLLVGVARKRLATSAPLATIALVLAATVGFLLKVGFVTRNW